MIQRYEFYLGSDDIEPEDDGQFVKHSDHEAAIAEARRQEREQCVAEISGIVRDWKLSAITARRKRRSI